MTSPIKPMPPSIFTKVFKPTEYFGACRVCKIPINRPRYVAKLDKYIWICNKQKCKKLYISGDYE